jgi:ribosomal protein L40E
MTMPAGWNSNKTNDGQAYPGPENIIWQNNVMTGIIHRKVVETQVITNFHVVQNSRSIPLSDIDDIVIMNQHRESQFQGNRYHFRGSGLSYGTGRSSGKSIGDLVFIYQGQPGITFRQISDPSGVARLAKAARRNMIQQIKSLEKQQIKAQKEQERQRKMTEKAHYKQFKTETELTCQKCQSTNPQDALFCNKCGSKLDAKYIDLNNMDGLSENKSNEVVEPNFFECLLPEYNVKINYPSTWTRRDDTSDPCKVIFQSPKEGPSDPYLDGLGVAVDETLGNMTPQHFIEVNIADMRKNNSDFTLFESTPTTLSGVPAHQMVYLANNKKTLVVATVRNNIFYWLQYAAEPESYLKFLSSVEQMISSFQFLG